MTTKKKKRSQKKKQQNNISTFVKFELLGIALCTLAIISFANLGLISITIRLFTSIFMGSWGFLILLTAFFLGIYVIIKRKFPDLGTQRIFGFYLITTSILIFAHISAISSKKIPLYENNVFVQTWEHIWNNFFSDNPELEIGGGMLGASLFFLFSYLFGVTGSKIIAFAFFLSGFILTTNLSIKQILVKLVYPLKKIIKIISTKKATAKTNSKTADITDESPNELADFSEEYKVRENNQQTEMPIANNKDAKVNISNFSDNIEPIKTDINDINNELTIDSYNRREDDSDYSLPPLSLLKSVKKTNKQKTLTHINKNAQKLEDTLHSFGVKAKVSQIHLGPAVTQYEITPETGVKVSKIVSLADDIALALAAKDIRIEAPIPGKSAVGIEVPNPDISIVTLREVLEQVEATNNNNLLSVAIGRDITGAPIFAELNKMPHLLVAGSTGSGKSVCINGIIISLLMRAKPHELKMVMIDPKMVELNIYNGIPHLLSPVVTDPKRAAKALYKIVAEMERRYGLFSDSNTRNIEGYNKSIENYNEINNNKKSLLPYIVVIIDELADLMMIASSDVEDAIIRIAQMARAAGIHLIIATQRPSVDVITGIIKANIPSRIAFAVSSNIDSRTIIDSSGAEKLLGRGDMLFSPIGTPKPVRVQGAFLSDTEVENIVNHVIAEQPANYNPEMVIEEETSGGTNNMEKVDELFEDAIALVIDMQTASASLLQRRFRIGYSRASRLIDEMENLGIVGPYEGSKPRKVLKKVPPEK